MSSSEDESDFGEDSFVVSDGSEDDFEADEETPKKKAPAKKAAAKKSPVKKAPKKAPAKKGKKVDSDDEDDDPTPKKPVKRKVVSDDEDDELSRAPTPKKKKTNEQIYQKKTPLEHILLRPDSYVGSVERQDQDLWVYDQGMLFKKISYVPGLYKIFDEIIVNAADNYQRDRSMSTIKVNIDAENNTISVYNNGSGIPIEIHAEEKVYIPEMIFGELLTSSNYDDSEKKVTGGRNGYGAKLTNIFSTEFVVETASSKGKKKYTQTFRNNMSKKEEPKIGSYSGEDYTQVTFHPDLAKFGMTHLDEDIISLMTKRVYDLAGCNSKLKIFLNGTRLPIKSFDDYVAMYLKDSGIPHFTEKVNDRWEVCVGMSDGHFEQVSFVNSVCTTAGGTHVSHAVEKVVKALLEAASKKSKAEIKPQHVKHHLFVFVRALIENPAFDSQTKGKLTTPASQFGSKCDLSDAFIKKILKSPILKKLLEWHQFQNQALYKNVTRKNSTLADITTLEDAKCAGKNKSSKDCTLILCEGESAKTLVVAGLSIVGRDLYGVFPLRGKVLNVRDAAFSAVQKNKELEHIVRILGLKPGVEYNDVSKLRYGHLMIMTDQDHDGSHIKGLLLNFFQFFWPSLLKVDGFLKEFITPIVRADKGKQSEYFFTLQQYQTWKNEGNTKGWDIRYLKGLGSSSDRHGKEYFKNKDIHEVEFSYEDTEGRLVDMAFSKSRADDRKEWILGAKPEEFIDTDQGVISVTDFINKELVQFSIAACKRAIPSMLDGFKPTQRKILYTCLRRKLKKTVKVNELQGAVSELTHYHHGDMSLCEAIIGLAQRYVGSNNINLLYPDGQFGSRYRGGKDAASPRYISTRLEDIVRTLFVADDENVIEYAEDDGAVIEPEWFIPIIPMILVNGASGLGVAWSCDVPCYNPVDIVANLRRMLKDETPEPIHPWYNGFKGEFKFSAKDSNYTTTGVYKRIDDTTLEISELPIGTWTENYKSWLSTLRADYDASIDAKVAKKAAKGKGVKGKKAAAAAPKKKAPAKKKKKADSDDDDDDSEEDEKEKKKTTAKPVIVLDSIEEDHSTTEVKFRLYSQTKLPTDHDEILKMFKLTSKISIKNMTLYDAEGRIRKYESPEAIMKDYFAVRMKYYNKRKEYLVNKLSEEWRKLDNKARFVLAVINKEIIINNKKKKDIVEKLVEMKFDPFDPKQAKTKSKKPAEGEENAEEEDEKEREETGTNNSYDYLLSMPLWNLTYEKVQKIKAERDAREKDLKTLIDTSLNTMYTTDLDAFEAALEKKRADDGEEDEFVSFDDKGKKKVNRKKAPRKKVVKKQQDSDDEDFGGSSSKSKPKAAAKPAAAKPATKAAVKTEVKTETKSTNKSITDFFGKGSAKPKPDIVAITGSDDDELPLAERLKRKGSPSPFKPDEPKKRATKKTVKKEDSDDEHDMFAMDSDSDKPKKKPKAAGRKKKTSDDEDDKPKKKPKAAGRKKKAASDDDVSEDDEKPKKKPKAAGRKKKEESDDEKPKKKPKAAGRKKKADSEEEEEESDVFSEDDDESDAKPPARSTGGATRKSTRSKAAVSYAAKDDDSDVPEFDDSDE